MKEEALDRTLWRTRFGGGYGPFVRQTAEWLSQRYITRKGICQLYSKSFSLTVYLSPVKSQTLFHISLYVFVISFSTNFHALSSCDVAISSQKAIKNRMAAMLLCHLSGRICLSTPPLHAKFVEYKQNYPYGLHVRNCTDKSIIKNIVFILWRNS